VRDARRLPSYTIVARTRMYTYAANVCDLSIVQGPFPAAPRQTLNVTIRNFFAAVSERACRAHRWTARKASWASWASWRSWACVWAAPGCCCFPLVLRRRRAGRAAAAAACCRARGTAAPCAPSPAVVRTTPPLLSTQWFTIPGTHTFTTSGTRTLMSQHQLRRTDSSITQWCM
jgi:hypothetical protein